MARVTGTTQPAGLDEKPCVVHTRGLCLIKFGLLLGFAVRGKDLGLVRCCLSSCNGNKSYHNTVDF